MTKILFAQHLSWICPYKCYLYRICPCLDQDKSRYLTQIYTTFVHIYTQKQMHNYPVYLQDKCHICLKVKYQQMWQISCLNHIWTAFVWRQICFFAQCNPDQKLHHSLPPKNYCHYNLRRQCHFANPVMRTKRFCSTFLPSLCRR